MLTKRLGKSNLEISSVGLGAWAIGGPWEWGWSDQNDDDSVNTIHKALDSGINWIDTAPIYGFGHSEEIIGQVLKETSHKPFIFTKCGFFWGEDKKEFPSLKRDTILKEVDNSLMRLGIDAIDLYQIHWPNPEQDIEEAWETLAEIKETGKIRYIAVSNFSAEQMKRIANIAPLTSNQPPYSLIARRVEKEILPYCQENNIGVLCYSPMGSGMLTGKMTRERAANLPHDDWRNKKSDFKEPKLSRNLELVGLLRSIGEEHHVNPGAVAIAWTLANSAVTASIVGLRKPQQVQDALDGGNLELSLTELDTINAFFK